jgi:hypothetical protein
MYLVMRFLFLILFHHEIGFVANIRYYASDVLADAFVGTILNLSSHDPRCFTD